MWSFELDSQVQISIFDENFHLWKNQKFFDKFLVFQRFLELFSNIESIEGHALYKDTPICAIRNFVLIQYVTPKCPTFFLKKKTLEKWETLGTFNQNIIIIFGL